MSDGPRLRAQACRFYRVGWLFVVLICGVTGRAQALGLSEWNVDGLCRGVVLNGDIARNEAPELIKRMIAMAERCGSRTIVMERMPGGSVNDAIAVGEAIRSREYITVMLPGSICASACGLIYLAGVQRYWRPNARFIIHRPEIRVTMPFKSIAEENQAYDELKIRLIRYVAAMGANPDYVEAMYVIGGDNPGPKERTLENVDLTRLGLVTQVGAPF